MNSKRSRVPSIPCPHCGERAIVRSSVQLTELCREMRLRCDNDGCGHQFVAQIEIVRTVAPSLRPNPEIRLPFGNQNLRWARTRPANDDVPIPSPDNDTGDILTRSG